MIKLGTTKLLSNTTAVLQIGVEYLYLNLYSPVLVHLDTSDVFQISRAAGENKNCVGIPRTIYAMQNDLKISNYLGGTLGLKIVICVYVLFNVINGTDSINPEVFDAVSEPISLEGSENCNGEEN